MKRRPKGKPWDCPTEEKALPVPESIRYENGREIKVYPKRYADGYRAQRNVKPKRVL